MYFLLSFIIFSSLANAESNTPDCGDCAPLAEVSITNEGLEKLISISLDENLRILDQEVAKRAGFRPLVFDKSHCPVQTVSEAFFKSADKKDSCYGLPDFSPDSLAIGGNTKLRPYRAEISDFKLNKIDLQLASPVKCKNFVCDFEIKANQIDIQGDMQVKFTDGKKEDFLPKTPISLKTTDKSDIRLSGQVLIKPETGHINDLVFLKDDTAKISVKPESLRLSLGVKTTYSSKQEEMRIRSQNFHKFVKTAKIDARYVSDKADFAIRDLVFTREKEIQDQRKKDGKKELPWQEARRVAEADVNRRIKEKFGSIQKFKHSLADIKWPSPSDPQATYQFMENPPWQLELFPEIKDQLLHAEVAATAENAGYKNPTSLYYTAIAANLMNQAASVPFLVKDFLEPLIAKEVLPVVQQEVNNELRNLRQYWNEISKIPTLNAQNLKLLSDLQDKLASSKSSEEKKLLQQKIDLLKRKMETDWLPIDTEVAIDKNTRDGKLLKAQISKRNPACNDQPKKFSDNTDTDFDLRTGFGVNTLQEYFNRMAENKNLDLCLDSEDPIRCEGGTKIRLQRPPKISCENGEFNFELDAEAAKKILGFDAEVDVGAKLKANIQNCSGSPCIQIKDTKGRFKNILLNTFFGNMLDRGISSAMAKTGNIPINVPYVDLKKHKTDPKTCNTQLDWNLKAPEIRKP